MSTIILTETHIAQDHLVLSQSLPSTISVDRNWSKIFVSPCSTFLVATYGVFTPSVLASPEVMEKFSMLLDFLIKVPRPGRFDKSRSNTIERICDGIGTIDDFYLVSATHRFRVCLSEIGSDGFEVKGSHAIGSNAHIARGLVDGGMPIASVYDWIADRCRSTSREHTVYQISDLLTKITEPVAAPDGSERK